MKSVQIDVLARKIKERRAEKGIRACAAEVGVSPATLSRIENGKVPDLDTFGKVCKWLGEDPRIYLGLEVTNSAETPKAKVHFKKGTAIKKDSAKALGELILKVNQALIEES